NDAHRAGHGLRAIECPLWTAQHLDALDIDDVRIESLEHRRVIDVEAGGVRALDAANRDAAAREGAIRSTRCEGEIRDGIAVIPELRDSLRFELLRPEHGHAEANILHVLRALPRRDDDFLESRGRRRLAGGRLRLAGCGYGAGCDERERDRARQVRPNLPHPRASPLAVFFQPAPSGARRLLAACPSCY